MSHEQINVDIMAYSENELTPHKKMSSARCLFLLKRWLSKCQQPEKHRSHIFVKFVVTSTCVLSIRIYIYSVSAMGQVPYLFLRQKRGQNKCTAKTTGQIFMSATKKS